MKKRYVHFIVILLLATVWAGCGDDDVDKNNSVFDVESLQSQNEFDVWIENNFRITYNTSIVYKFDYMDTDFSYNLTPVKFVNATKFAQIIKYCWYELYNEVANIDFTRETAPKQIYLIGSTGLDTSTNSEVLATASGGLRVVVYKLNSINDFNYTNVKDYMHRMHHEFSHILDQKNNIDKTFGAISEADYVGDNWSSTGTWIDVAAANKMGFVTKYASSEANEDYAEVYSKYITLTDAEWEALLASATVYNSDGVATNSYGRNKILQKVNFIAEYLKESWDIDMEELRAASLRRASKATDIEFITFSEFSK